MTVHIHHSFIRLPDDGYEPRRHDPRAGYGANTYQDYATPLGQDMTQRFIRRHRLEKVDPSAAVSDPVEPIVFYLDQIFLNFDLIAEKHGLNRIKTIGDAYMAASGLPIDDPEFHEIVVDFVARLKEQLEAMKQADQLAEMDQLLLPSDAALDEMPMLQLSESGGFYIRQGQPVLVPNAPCSGMVRIALETGEFLGVGEILDDGRVAPRRLVVAAR